MREGVYMFFNFDAGAWNVRNIESCLVTAKLKNWKKLKFKFSKVANLDYTYSVLEITKN